MTTIESNEGGPHYIDPHDIDSAIRQEGYDAGKAGKQWFDCPYPSTTRESLSWMTGLVEAVREQEDTDDNRQPIGPGNW